MKKKKIIKLIIILIIIVVLCIPFPIHYVGYGNIEYKAVLYTVTKISQRPSVPPSKKEGNYFGEYNVGTTVEILGFEVYNDVHTVTYTD